MLIITLILLFICAFSFKKKKKNSTYSLNTCVVLRRISLYTVQCSFYYTRRLLSLQFYQLFTTEIVSGNEIATKWIFSLMFTRVSFRWNYFNTSFFYCTMFTRAAYFLQANQSSLHPSQRLPRLYEETVHLIRSYLFDILSIVHFPKLR